MARSNPTGDKRLVPVDLPDDQVVLLRNRFLVLLDGVHDDLKSPEKLRHLGRARAEAAVFERLLAGLDEGKILIPDEPARATVHKLAVSDDRESDYHRVVAHHDAMHGLVAVLAGQDS